MIGDSLKDIQAAINANLKEEIFISKDNKINFLQEFLISQY